MKAFRHRLLLSQLFWTGALLAVLLIVVGQLFSIYGKPGYMGEVWLILIIVFSVALVITAFFAHRIIRTHALPIENVTETALELAKGNYQARAFENSSGASIELSTSINILARNLQEIAAIREMEQERLKTLIENMGSGLIMIGRQGSITLVNEPFLKEFKVKEADVYQQFYKELPVPEELQQFFEEVFMTEEPARQQVEITQGIVTKHLNVYGAPVIGSHERWLGIVIVLHDITELKRLEQVRKDFVANVSHELRTPITSIKGFTETLLDGAYHDETSLLSFLEIIQNESNRLEVLVKDLLELSKIEQSGYQVNVKPLKMETVILQAIESVRFRLQDKEIALKTELSPVKVTGDDNRLVQVMINLLINAATYSPEQTTITIRLYKNDSDAIIEVEDEGIGIEASEIGRLFERFYRVDRARSRNSGGTGLGLSIVKHIVELHQGNIEVESEVGKGTKFILSLPLAEY